MEAQKNCLTAKRCASKGPRGPEFKGPTRYDSFIRHRGFAIYLKPHTSMGLEDTIELLTIARAKGREKKIKAEGKEETIQGKKNKIRECMRPMKVFLGIIYCVANV